MGCTNCADGGGDSGTVVFYRAIEAATLVRLSQWREYARLMRFDRPVGTFLLLWPTLWMLWLASDGTPRWTDVIVFTLGAVVMRAAGCVINDIADMRFDGHVARTRTRPLVSGSLQRYHAYWTLAILSLCAFLLWWWLAPLARWLALPALILTVIYPFCKRVFALPQLVLGVTFAAGVLFAAAHVTGTLGVGAWLLYVATVCWIIAYDTTYAMVDRADDLRLGLRSSAITFGRQDITIVGCLLIVFLAMMAIVAGYFDRHVFFFAAWLSAATLCGYQMLLIWQRKPADCMAAFISNGWVGALLFAGIVIDTAFVGQGGIGV